MTDIDSLIEGLDHLSPEVRLVSYSTLVQMGPDAVADLVKATHGSSPRRRRLAASILARGDRAGVTEALIDLFDSAQFVIRQTVAEILGERGDLAAVPALIAALEDESINVRLWAIESLGKLHDQRAVQPLHNLLNNTDSSAMRQGLIRALIQLQGGQAIDAIQQFANDEDGQVRSLVHDALAKYNVPRPPGKERVKVLQGKRIFIVEDNLSNRAVAQILLEQHGAVTAIDRWGQEAVQRLQEFAPVDLILMDLMLPGGISGFEVFDEIRRYPEFDQIPVVAVSAADAASAVPQAQKRGFAGFISKPLDFNLFPQQVVRLIAGEKIWYAPTTNF